MNVAVVQMEPAFGDLEANCARICSLLARADAPVVIFPELALSGYFFTDRQQLHQLALERDASLLQAIEDVATKQGKIAIVGFPEKEGDNIYNAVVLLGYQTERCYYRKVHLFYKERFVFTEGNVGFPVARVASLDLHIGLMICYDWRFPEAARTLALQGADLIACPSNLVTHIWRMAMPVRALENKVYVAVANRIGTESNGDETLSFNGRSAICGYNGSVLAELPADVEGIAVAPIEPDKTRSKSFNPINDLFADRRPWAYRL